MFEISLWCPRPERERIFSMKQFVGFQSICCGDSLLKRLTSAKKLI